MSKVRAILEMHAQGVSKKTMSLRTGVARNTVKKYIREYIAKCVPLEELMKLSDTELEKVFLVEPAYPNDEKYSQLKELFPGMEKELKKKGATLQKEWEKYLLVYPDGYRLSQFKVHYNRWCKKSDTTMHLDHKAGDKMYVDYAGQKLSIIDPTTGEIRSVEVFVAILGASQYTYVEASFSQQKEDFISSCENAVHYYGGSPQAIVPDNLKSAVTKSCKYEPDLCEAFKWFADHYRMTVLPAGPYKPRHKALVEGAVKIIYRTIYTTLQDKVFTSIEELNQAIRPALEQHNNRLFQNRPYSRKQLFDEIEKTELQSLPACRFELKQKRILTVMKNNHICLSDDKHYYSVPYRYVGKKVNVLYNSTQVEVYYRYECIARHQRNYRPYTYSTIADHLASKHKYQSDWNPEKFLERASLVGEETKSYVLIILEQRQHPEQAYKSCQGILGYAARVGKDRLNAACQRAAFYNEYNYPIIRKIIENKLDQAPLDQEPDREMPPHGNIRGNEYYQ